MPIWKVWSPDLHIERTRTAPYIIPVTDHDRDDVRFAFALGAVAATKLTVRCCRDDRSGSGSARLDDVRHGPTKRRGPGSDPGGHWHANYPTMTRTFATRRSSSLVALATDER